MNEKYKVLVQKFVANHTYTCKPMFVLEKLKENFGNEEMDESGTLPTDQKIKSFVSQLKKKHNKDQSS